MVRAIVDSVIRLPEEELPPRDTCDPRSGALVP